MGAALGLASRAGTVYGNASTARPVLVQSTSGAAIATAGDILMQRIAPSEAGHDWGRTARIAAHRLLVWGPGYSLWMRGLERFVRFPASRAVPAKILLDQLIWTPPSVGSFYFTMAVLEGKSTQDGVDRAQQMLWPTLQVNWPFWSCVQAVTFGVVPVPYRVAFVSTIHVGWNAWLSHMNEHARRSSLLDKQQS